MKKEHMAKRSAIKRLLYDDPCSADRMSVGEEYAAILSQVADLDEQLTEKPKGTNTGETFKRYKDAFDDLVAIEAEAYFEKGIKFGVKFGMEIADD